MEPELKSRWIEALTDGSHIQAEGVLYDGSTDRGIPKMCCLGVLEHVCGNDIQVFKQALEEETHLALPEDLKDAQKAPKDFLKQPWEGRRWDRDTEEDKYTGDLEGYLAHMNDYGRSFEEISEYINENL